ncbi:hypothetical protein H0H93_004198 [Arthromyces matolae]|nr:hypothetical protein H0H93_004198 [Arthromyces matolae]
MHISYPLQVLLGLLTSADPTVRLDGATLTGKVSQSGRSHQFLGVPYVQAPVGNRRFRLPEPIESYTGDISADAYGPSCPQQPSGLQDLNWLDRQLRSQLEKTILGSNLADSEDCLTINVVKPASATPSSKLPVVVWMHDGLYIRFRLLSAAEPVEGLFDLGGSSLTDGSLIVDRSSDLKSEVIYVSMNYRKVFPLRWGTSADFPVLSRLSAFGFLASKEVKNEGVGNLGLHDQRAALRWVQKYIGAFGGDSDKVTLWGGSSGAISASLQMVTNGGDAEDLFRAAIMQSGGGPISIRDIEDGQQYYDALVGETGCSSSSRTLECLRKVPYDTLKKAINKSPKVLSYQSLNLAWRPRVDGVFLTENPQYSILRGRVSRVPVIIGNCDDEATIFSIPTLNITLVTTADLRSYILDNFLQGIPDDQADLLLKYYPDDQRAGSPFDTGLKNALSAQFKRTAAILTDAFFQAPRRFFLKCTSGTQPSWAFTSKWQKATPYMGSFIGSDLSNSYGDALRDYIIRFVVNLDPNGNVGMGIPWPQYDTNKPQVVVFQDSALFPMLHLGDTYRSDQMDYMTNLTLLYPL